MPLPLSGAIRLRADAGAEVGLGTSNNVALGSTSLRDLYGISSGPIRLAADGYGKSFRTAGLWNFNGVQGGQVFTDSGRNYTGTTSGTNTFTRTAGFSPFGSGDPHLQSGSQPIFFSSGTGLGNYTGDYTIEFWYYQNGQSDGGTTYSRMLSHGPVDAAIRRISVGGASPLRYETYDLGPGGTFFGGTSSIAFIFGAWTHIAKTRSGSTVRLFVDGTQRISYTFSGGVSLNSFTLGNSGAEFYSGWFDDLRISRIARYTANFIRPSASFVVD